MIRQITALALGVVLVGPPAMAAPSPIARTFGNTIVSTYPDGRKAELWLQPGGAYAARGRRGDGSSGHWSLKGDRICLRQSRPIPVPLSFCTAMPAAQNGAWSAKAVTGEPLRVRLVKGRG